MTDGRREGRKEDEFKIATIMQFLIHSEVKWGVREGGREGGRI